MKTEHITYLKHLIIFLIISVGLFKLGSAYIFNNPVFSFTSSDKKVQSSHVSTRQVRNEVKMKQSYGQLMSLGTYHLERGDWEEAIEHFYTAKTLFPDRIDPRKNLCYGYFMKCQKNRHYCKSGKRELYYAMKYVNTNDKSTFHYLNNLVELVGLNSIVKMEEKEALAAIF